MGVQGTLEYFSDLLSSTKKKKKKQMQTVALKIRMDCEGCARKVKHVLSDVKGISSSSSSLKTCDHLYEGYVICYMLSLSLLQVVWLMEN